MEDEDRKDTVRNAQEIAEFIAKRLGHIYERPLMYGGTAKGVDVLLSCYHELWAQVHQLEDEYQDIRLARYAKEGCGSAGFPFHYHRKRPDAPDEETAAYVVEQWKKISTMLGVPFERIQ
jgi:hypothetical protein